LAARLLTLLVPTIEPYRYGYCCRDLVQAGNNLHRRNLHFALLRGRCGLLRRCFRLFRRDLVKPANKAQIGDRESGGRTFRP
jgi:hypothetical protein